MKTKEQIFNEIPFLDKNGDYFNMPRTQILDAMEEYAQSYHESKVKKFHKPLVKSWFARLWERFDKFGDACINSLGSQI